MSVRAPALLHDSAGGELEAPTNLVTSEVTHRSFRATWTPPDGPVDKYRVIYTAVLGGPTQEVRSAPFYLRSVPIGAVILS